MSATAEPKTHGGRGAAAARGAARIGVGVIGFGWLGQAHTRSLLRIPTLFEHRAFDTELVACSDALPARVDQAISSFGFKRASAAWESVIDDPDVEVVYIAAPNMVHVAAGRGGRAGGQGRVLREAGRRHAGAGARAAARPRARPA